MIFILPYAIIDLEVQFGDMWVLAVNVVRREEARQGAVDGRTDEVATCGCTTNTSKHCERRWMRACQKYSMAVAVANYGGLSGLPT